MTSTADAKGVADAVKAKKGVVPLGSWVVQVQPRVEWAQVLREGWRVMRDHFYDPLMHGVDWDAVLCTHEPLLAKAPCQTPSLLHCTAYLWHP